MYAFLLVGLIEMSLDYNNIHSSILIRLLPLGVASDYGKW